MSLPKINTPEYTLNIPSTDEEINRAANDGVPIVVVPIAFVSEHSETLVELDIEYRELAISLGVPSYSRASTVYLASNFISGLKRLVKMSLKITQNSDIQKDSFKIISGSGFRVCSTVGSQCRNNEKC